MALYQSRGTISEMSEVQSGTGKNGYQWQRMSIVLDIPGFQGAVTKQCVEVRGDDIKDVLLFSIGDEVEVTWTMYAREWNGRWFNNVELVKISGVGDERTQRPAPESGDELDPESHEDDLPF